MSLIPLEEEIHNSVDIWTKQLGVIKNGKAVGPVKLGLSHSWDKAKVGEDKTFTNSLSAHHCTYTFSHSTLMLLLEVVTLHLFMYLHMSRVQ